MHVYPLLVFLPYVALHGAVDLVYIDGYLRFDVAWIVRFVRLRVPDALHVLAKCQQWKGESQRHGAHINLHIVPLVHAQGFDFGDVGAQFPVQRSASHAQKDAKLG